MKIGSLFSGYGGLDMAVEAYFGAETAWVSDICRIPTKDKPEAHFEPHRGPCLVQAHHRPTTPNLGDITLIDWAEVEPVDIITGGSPCQDLSHAGRRAGMTDGTRSNLWVQMREAIATIRPTFVVWENVRGAYSAAADSGVEPCPGCLGDDPGVVLRALGRVLGDLADLGYDAAWHGLRAADVGAPHGRFRVFVLAWDQAAAPADAAHHDSAGSADPREAGGGAGVSHADTEDLGQQRSGAAWLRRPGPADGRDGDVELLGTPMARDGKGVSSDTPRLTKAARRGKVEAQILLLPTPTSSVDSGGLQDDGTPYGPTSDKTLTDAVLREGEVSLLPTPRATRGGSHTETREMLIPTPTTQPATGNGHARNLGKEARGVGRSCAWGQYAAAIARWETTIGRPAPSPTEPGPKGNPRLAATFVEWLMGLDEGHVTAVPGLTRNDMLKLLGNGVVPQQALAALHILDSIRTEGLA